MLLKVEGEKSYHERVAAILGEVETEVSFYIIFLVQDINIGRLEQFLFMMAWNFVVDGLRETAERVCSPCNSVHQQLREHKILLGRGIFEIK